MFVCLLGYVENACTPFKACWSLTKHCVNSLKVPWVAVEADGVGIVRAQTGILPTVQSKAGTIYKAAPAVYKRRMTKKKRKSRGSHARIAEITNTIKITKIWLGKDDWT